MLPIDKLIKNRLMELCPQLRLDGFDTFVWRWCKDDMFLYLNYLEEHRSEVVTSAVIKYVKVYYYGMVFNAIPLLLLRAQATAYEKEFKEWANMWMGMWWKKFQQRVKLLLTPKPKRMLATQKECKKGRSIGDTKLNQKERRFIFSNAIKTLIENGEIVRPKTVARYQISLLLNQRMKDKEEWKAEDTINFDKSVRDNLKHLSHTHGPLLFVFPNKRAFMAERGTSKTIA